MDERGANRNDVLAESRLGKRNDVMTGSDLRSRNDVLSFAPERCPGGPHLVAAPARVIPSRTRRSFSPEIAHDVGALAGTTGTADVIDAHVVLVAASIGAAVLTSDGEDLSRPAGHLPTAPPINPL